MSTSTPRPSRHRLRRAAALILAPALAGSGALLVATSPAAEAATVPNTAKLAGALAKQTLAWEKCDFGEASLNSRLNKPNVSCATVKVPRDWNNPTNGKTWDIRISQAKNVDVTNGRYQGTIFVNPGGPGGSGLPWGPVMQERAVDLNPYYNYVGFDPRGVGQSSHASCTYSYDDESTDPNVATKAMAKACSTNEDVKTINTEQTTYDMDFIRHLLKAPKLDYIGYSYGTWLGAWYEKVFGAKYGGRFLLDSSIDATDSTLQATWDLQPVARDRQFQRHLMNWIARHDATYGLGTDPEKIYDEYFKAIDGVDPFIIVFTWAFSGGAAAFGNNAAYPEAAEVVKLFVDSNTPVPADAKNPAAATAALLDEATEAASGSSKAKLADGRDKAQALSKLKTRVQVSRSTPTSVVTATESDPFDFIRCNDGQWTQGDGYWNKANATLAKKAPFTASWGLLTTPACAYWKTSNLMPVADEDTFPKTIVLQGELDSQTGWEGGRKAGVSLPNTSLIAIDNEGSHGHFPYGTEAVDRPVYNLFLKNRLPKDITVAPALPLPEESKTFESWAPLNKKAKHVPSDFTDPFDPAPSPEELTDDGSPSALLASAEIQQLLKKQVEAVYGDKGVKLLDN